MENDEKIEHIVLSGGGIIFFPYYGYLRETAKKKVWDLKNIKTIYGTSAGAIIGSVLCLQMDWDVLDDYIIKRPWKSVFGIQLDEILSIATRKGFKDMEVFKKIFHPVLESQNVSVNITMKEYFELTKVDLHIFVTEVNSFRSLDINHKAYPDWKLIDAVYASAAVPIIFSPLYKDELYYVDGGLLNNFPLNSCLQNEKCERKNLLPLDIDCKTERCESKLSFFEILLTLFVNIFKTLSNRKSIPILENTVLMKLPTISLDSINSLIENAEKRIELINIGANMALEKYPFEIIYEID